MNACKSGERVLQVLVTVAALTCAIAAPQSTSIFASRPHVTVSAQTLQQQWRQAKFTILSDNQGGSSASWSLFRVKRIPKVTTLGSRMLGGADGSS